MNTKKTRKILGLYSFALFVLVVPNFTIFAEKEEKKILQEQDDKKEEKSKEVTCMAQGGKDKKCFEYKSGDTKIGFTLKDRIEAWYSKSSRLFNPSSLDQAIYVQSTLDLKAYADFEKIVKAMFNIRNKSRWGNATAIVATTPSPVKIDDALVGEHRHAIGRQLLWVREAWMEMLINKAFAVDSCTDHYFKIGFFPFELGRGISLGNAYATSPGLLGFYANNVIDQYAPGCLWNGEVLKDKWSYDFYIGILRNKSDSFDNVNEKIYANIAGDRLTPERGFGHLDFVLALRSDFKVKPCCDGTLTIEPYILYNKDPEQRVDFPADAHSDLATWGLYFDYEGKKVEWGVEFAGNFGSQKVRGLDRNVIQLRNVNGDAVFNYSHVIDVNSKTNALVTPDNRTAVNNAPQGVQYNGQPINSNLSNDPNRFRSEYKNFFKGFMIVGDIEYKMTDNFTIAATGAYASGDENPNKDLALPNDSQQDTDYDGFIGLQEIYSGTRVESLFVIGPNRITRPLSLPSINVPRNSRIASTISGFTNLIYTGIGTEYITPGCYDKEIKLESNYLMYWQPEPGDKFNIATGKAVPNSLARKFLGFEVNTFMEAKLYKALKAFIIAGVFVPMDHFEDIKGKPISREQLDILDRVDNTGFIDPNVLRLGTSPAFVFNWGFEFAF